MMERVRVDALLHGFSPLLVGNRHIANRPPDRPAQSFNDLPHGWSFVHERVYGLGGQARAGQKSGGYAGHVFGTGERDNGIAIAPRQERGVLLGHAPADKSAYVFVIGRRLKMNGPHLRPVEDTIRQAMLQIAKRGSVPEIAEAASSGVP